MTELLRRLRAAGDRAEGRPYSDMHGAADEIERLRAALTDMIDLAQTVSPYSLGDNAMKRIADAKAKLGGNEPVKEG